MLSILSSVTVQSVNRHYRYFLFYARFGRYGHEARTLHVASMSYDLKGYKRRRKGRYVYSRDIQLSKDIALCRRTSVATFFVIDDDEAEVFSFGSATSADVRRQRSCPADRCPDAYAKFCNSAILRGERKALIGRRPSRGQGARKLLQDFNPLRCRLDRLLIFYLTLMHLHY